MWRPGTWLLTLALALAGCTTVESQGALKKLELFRDRCEDRSARARVKQGAEATLELTVRCETICASGVIRTFRTERSIHSWVLPAIVGTLAGALVEVPLIVALYFIASKATNSSGVGDVVYLLLLPGVAVGTAVATAMGHSELPLPDGPDEIDEEIESTQNKTRLSGGTLTVEDEPTLTWQLHEGKVSLPIELLWRHDLGRLLVDGMLLEYDDEDRRQVIAPLEACRRAFKGWLPDAQLSCFHERARRIDAQACHAAGHPYADPVLQRLRELGCDDAQPR